MPQRLWRISVTLLTVGLACGLFALSAHAQVTFERLLNSAKEPQNWLTYSGDYSGRRFSELDQINVANARSLTAKWVYQTGATGKLETTPLIVDGILYATGQDDRAFALDARTGRPNSLCLHLGDYGTRESSLIFVTAAGRVEHYFAPGPPCTTAYAPAPAPNADGIAIYPKA